jgi:hypothetical protein
LQQELFKNSKLDMRKTHSINAKNDAKIISYFNYTPNKKIMQARAVDKQKPIF